MSDIRIDVSRIRGQVESFVSIEIARALVIAEAKAAEAMRAPKTGKEPPKERRSKMTVSKTGRVKHRWLNRRSAPGEAPAVQEGILIGDLAWAHPKPLEGYIGVGRQAPYAKYLEPEWVDVMKDVWMEGEVIGDRPFLGDAVREAVKEVFGVGI